MMKRSMISMIGQEGFSTVVETALCEKRELT